jgi:two-component system, cell cycle response regulator
MSSGLVDELQEIPLDRENQDLKEILEIAFQITAQLEIENVIKNVVWSFVSKFQIETATFALPGDMDENAVQVISYKGVKKEDLGLSLGSLQPIFSFLDKNEYSQIPFSYFRENYTDRQAVESMAMLGTEVIVPLRTDKGSMGILLLPRTGTGQPYGLSEVQYITRIVRFASIAIENASLFRQATTDRMTGLFSHHFFEKRLDEELERARRYKSTFSLVMFDIDHFKKFNDTYGHLQGDRIIREIARLLGKSVRQVDLAARYGGEEFAVILPGVDVKGALVVAERIRKKVEGFPFPSLDGGTPLHVTISVGVTEFEEESAYAPTEIIREADQALYKSKENGRNRVTVSSPRSA